MFICFAVVIENVIFEFSNLTLSKFINCKKINSPFLEGNKLLCMYEKNVTKDQLK